MEHTKIEMLLPKNKKGAVILLKYYTQLTDCIIATIQRGDNGEVTLHELIEQVQTNLSGIFRSNLWWHLLHVKQDLEARGVIKTMVNHNRTPIIRLKRKGLLKRFDKISGMSSRPI